MSRENILMNEALLRKIVRATEKACGEDTRGYLRENSLETNNALPFLRGDFINENLRNAVVNDDIEMIPFNRYGWSGRILHDKLNKITYTITTKRTLDAIPKKKGRSVPHYLQSILYAENGDCKASVKQMSLNEFGDFGIVHFNSQELESDYDKIMKGHIAADDKYRHYIVAYEVEHNEVIDINLQFLDKDFDVIAECSLNDYLKPDFGRLTETEPVEETATEGESVHSLINVKAGIKPKLREIEKQA